MSELTEESYTEFLAFQSAARKRINEIAELIRKTTLQYRYGFTLEFTREKASLGEISFDDQGIDFSMLYTGYDREDDSEATFSIPTSWLWMPIECIQEILKDEDAKLLAKQQADKARAHRLAVDEAERRERAEFERLRAKFE